MQSDQTRILSFSKTLTADKYCTFTYHSSPEAIEIYIIDSHKDNILRAILTYSTCPSLLLLFFGKQLDKLYSYLARDDCQIGVQDEAGLIRFDYSILSIASRGIARSFSLTTKQYTSQHFFLPHQAAKRQPSAILVQNKSEKEVKKDKGRLLECSYNFQICNEEATLAKISKVDQHPDWYLNKESHLCLQLSNQLSAYQIKDFEKGYEGVTYRFHINLNQFHTHTPPRYDLTIGFADAAKITELKRTEQPNFKGTISLTVDSRWATSQCFSLQEQKEFAQPISPYSLEIYVTVSKKGIGLPVENIKLIVNEKQLINIFNEQSLLPLRQSLSQFQTFCPFVYFHRSFLHFRFSNRF